MTDIPPVVFLEPDYDDELDPVHDIVDEFCRRIDHLILGEAK